MKIVSQILFMSSFIVSFFILTAFTSSNKTLTVGELTDSRDGQTYSWMIMKDGEKWMTENLNFEMPDSWCYDDETNNCGKFGRLYTWSAAIKACPEGWHLPTESEWWELTKHYGKSDKTKKQKHTTKGAKAVYRMMIEGGKSDFSVKLGGNRSLKGNFYSIEESGSFWSSTSDLIQAKYIVFSKKYAKFHKFVAPKGYGESCRCVQN